jgi:hypothetical protein
MKANRAAKSVLAEQKKDGVQKKLKFGLECIKSSNVSYDWDEDDIEDAGEVSILASVALRREQKATVQREPLQEAISASSSSAFILPVSVPPKKSGKRASPKQPGPLLSTSQLAEKYPDSMMTLPDDDDDDDDEVGASEEVQVVTQDKGDRKGNKNGSGSSKRDGGSRGVNDIFGMITTIGNSISSLTQAAVAAPQVVPQVTPQQPLQASLTFEQQMALMDKQIELEKLKKMPELR